MVVQSSARHRSSGVRLATLYDRGRSQRTSGLLAELDDGAMHALDHLGAGVEVVPAADGPAWGARWSALVEALAPWAVAA